VNIEEYLRETLSVEAFDETVERLAEAVAEDLDPDADEPSEEELAEIDRRLDEEALAEARRIARAVRRMRQRMDPFERPDAFLQGRHRVYRLEKLPDGSKRVVVRDMIPVDDGTPEGSFREIPVTILTKGPAGWRCHCRQYVTSGACEHISMLHGWRKPSPMDGQAHTWLCMGKGGNCGAPAWAGGYCLACLAELREHQWSSELWHRTSEMVLCPSCGAKVKVLELRGKNQCMYCADDREPVPTTVYRREGRVIRIFQGDKPVGILVKEERGWRCGCAEYVQEGDCEHARDASRWDRSLESSEPEEEAAPVLTDGEAVAEPRGGPLALLQGKLAVLVEEEEPARLDLLYKAAMQNLNGKVERIEGGILLWLDGKVEPPFEVRKIRRGSSDRWLVEVVARG